MYISFLQVSPQNIEECTSCETVYPDCSSVVYFREDEDEGRATSRIAPVALTPEMVNAQFSLIDPSSPTEEKVPA